MTSESSSTVKEEALSTLKFKSMSLLIIYFLNISDRRKKFHHEFLSRFHPFFDVVKSSGGHKGKKKSFD